MYVVLFVFTYYRIFCFAGFKVHSVYDAVTFFLPLGNDSTVTYQVSVADYIDFGYYNIIYGDLDGGKLACFAVKYCYVVLIKVFG